jgi:hypothetical protein
MMRVGSGGGAGEEDTDAFGNINIASTEEGRDAGKTISAYQRGWSVKGYRVATLAQNKTFPRKTGTATVKDHGIATRRADAAEPSRCRRTRRG